MNTASEEMETSSAYRARLKRLKRAFQMEATLLFIFINLLRVLPEMEGPKPPVFVSGWSLRPGWRSQYNKPHEGQMNTATACQQG